MRSKKFPIGLIAAFVIFAATLLGTGTRACAQTETVLLSFDKNEEGYELPAGLIFDASGNLYGTTYWGGKDNYGTVFELTLTAGGSWTEAVLCGFNGEDGSGPEASLIFDGAGNLYGTTYNGGEYGYGTVFELTPTAGGAWTKKVLHSFNDNGEDGYGPFASLIFDASGNLYGTTYNGGTYSWGTVFELKPKAGGSWAEKVLHSFNDNGTDAARPYASLIFDASGNLYGTTGGGGTYSLGTVFELKPKAGGGWAEAILYNFDDNGRDGWGPVASLIFDAVGNLYGTTSQGGAHNHGTVFEMKPKAGGGWSEASLHSFDNQDGYGPQAGLIFDAAGNLYGTTYLGGAYGDGVVFELSPAAGRGWTESVLWSFNGTDGSSPYASLIFDGSGNLYGTTSVGGAYSGGTVFEITP
jgi:uncharacterized repeat protein (TIGR03803 family)